MDLTTTISTISVITDVIHAVINSAKTKTNFSKNIALTTVFMDPNSINSNNELTINFNL
jgi:hypothetical protein